MAGPLARFLSLFSGETHGNCHDEIISKSFFPVMRAGKLLHPHRSLMKSIRRMVGVPNAYWNELYQPLFEAYAEFVQQLPASEAHHHAGPGGMLNHALEVVNESLKLRRGQLLPHGATAEDLALQQDLYTYAVTTGALMHDTGKPAADQKIELLDRSGKSLGFWNPWDGAMNGRASWYRVEFVRNRKYRLHERLPLLLVHYLVPREGLSWLSGNLEVFDAWIAAISGNFEDAGPLGQIIQQADGISVSRDLAGAHAQMPSARQKPLSSRLLTGLRFLLDNHVLPLNRKGAAGWLIDGDAWLVSKRILDALREHLEQEGHGGIPRRNDRLMDELQQHGLLIPNEEDRAIWTATITIGDWRQEFTLLRVPAHIIWPNEETRPEPCDGNITISPGPGENIEEKEAAPQQDPEKRGDSSPVTPNIESSVESEAADTPSREQPKDTGDHGEAAGLQPEPPSDISLPLPPGIELAAGDNGDESDAKEHEEGGSAADHSADGEIPAKQTKRLDAGEAFVQWLKDGLASGRMLINTASARIHVVREGLLLVSPQIFKDFDPERWSYVQKRFLKLKVHQKNPDGTNIWTYQTEGSKKRNKLKGIRIEQPKDLLGYDLPDPNPHLSLYQKPEVKDDA